MSEIRCHTVPKFYLNYFLESGFSLFWVYDKKVVESRPQTPINTTVIGDYYLSSADKAGKKDTRMEAFLATIEGMVKPILDEWRNNPSQLDDEVKPIVAMFLSFMHSRVSRAVEAVKEISMAGLEHVIDEMKKVTDDSGKLKEHFVRFRESEEGKNCNVSLEEFRELIANPRKYGEPTINEKYAIGESFNMAQAIHYWLMKMNWSICHTKGKRFFVTNDTPLNVFVQTEKGRAIFGGGFGLPNVEIAFPLSPKLCLWLDKRKGPRYRIMGADFVEEVNRRTIHMAERFVISPYKSNRIQRVVREFAAHYGKPKIDVEVIKERFKEK